MKFLKVLWSDIRNISKSKFLKMTIIAITLLPLAYGGLYLAAFWDPYGKTETLPVAVVNLDKGGEREEIRVNYGDDVVDGLKNNDKLGWRFVKTLKEAEDGLEGDDYYAMLVIPKDFSQRILDVENGKLKKPKVIFKGNKKKNYVVGLITDKASEAIEKEIREKAGSKFTEIVVDKVEEVRDGLETASEATSLMKDGVTQLKDKIPTMTDAIGKIHDGSSTLNEKLEDAKDGSSKFMEGVGTLKGKMPDLLDGVDKLDNATSILNNNVKDAYDGSVILRNGALGLYDKLPDLSDGIDKINDGSQSLKEAVGQVNDNMPDMIDGVEKLKDGAFDLRNGIGKVSKNISDKLDTEEDKKKEDSDEKDDGKSKKKIDEQVVNKLVEGLKPLIPKLTDEKQGLPYLASGLGKVSMGLDSLKDRVPEGQKKIILGLKSKIDVDKSDMDALVQAFKAVGTEDESEVKGGLLQLSKLLVRKDIDTTYCVIENTIKDSTNIQEVIKQLGKNYGIDIENVPKDKLPEQLKPLKELYDGCKIISSTLSKLHPSFKELEDGLNMYQVMYQMVKYDTETVDKLSTVVEGLNALYEGSDKLYKGLDTLYDKTKALQDGVGLLYNGSKDLNDGTDKFQGTIPLVINGIAQLSDGTRDLSDGLFKLDKGTQTLNEKVGELNQKVPDMQEGVSELYDGSFQLTDGISKLIDGSGRIKDGLSSLQGKMPDLQDGVDRLYEGTATLNSSLTKGAEKVSDKLVRSSKTMGDFVAKPIDLDDTPVVEVDKYGLGLSPYFVSLGLWVGALMMFFLIGDDVGKDLNNVRPSSVVLGKYLFCCIIGAIQAVCLSLAVFKLGLRPTNIPAYIGFNIFLSCVFIAVAQNLIFLFGDIGRLSVVLILLLQLTASGGTFPRELLPTFFQKVNPVLPFTYSISALREISWGVNSNVLIKDIAILSGIAIAFLVMSMILKRYTDKFKNLVSIEHEREKSLQEEETIDAPTNTISQ
ncbi:YhgE/Pip family protein [Clostridium lundense]|uniref:YhgE/Pip family protein n=1 Tax=Clostridium lundense TaxID=319475 RepID=UPI0004822CF2|nr:YhgE/Pip domain-containing protein [Clostridium lundense]